MEISFTLRNVLLGSAILGVIGGMLGTFTLLRRQSLLGDALAHAALPGVCLAFLITHSKVPWTLFLGALMTAIAGSLAILVIVQWSRIKEDTAIGIILSVFFAFGIVLLTYIQKLPLGNQSGLDKYLFGQAATLVTEDLKLMATLSALVFILIFIFYKELKLLVFDREFGATQGYSIRTLEVLFTILVVLIVVIGLQTVGVVLMVATLITPAAAARQWTNRLSTMLCIAAAFGGLAGATGATASAIIPRLPTGPAIVLISSVFLIISLFLAPQRGILWSVWHEWQTKQRIRQENLLKDIYHFVEPQQSWYQAIPWSILMGIRGQTNLALRKSAAPLLRKGLLAKKDFSIALTTIGKIAAEEVVRKHRLWEVYLSRKLELAQDHVHRDAEAMEHVLTDIAIAELEQKLNFPKLDPHGRPIPPRPIT